ncbi:MAG: FAD-dependent oxidoreductase [Phycisphaerales bacterium]|nr:MAG: FAD-dependent oxidoreductase [Phycisphaerales bacterium]
MRKDSRLLLSAAAAMVTMVSFPSSAPAATLLVEAEGFAEHGGWFVDQQYMDQMGSPVLLAHGMGVPVADATTTVRFPAPGEYRVLVRTRDWVAPWKVPGAPGKFQLLIDGRAVKTVFGTKGAEWHWHDGGSVRIGKKQVTLALHDLTGFDGRCDAIVFTTDPTFVPPNKGEAMTLFRRKLLGFPDEPEDAGTFDFVVVGGGMAGTCAAISAARLGCTVALIQNRPVLGGNNSSEVRVHLNGKINMPPYSNLGNLVRELGPRRQGNARPAENYEDGKKLTVARAEENLQLFLNTHAFGVEMDGKRISAVIAKNTWTNKELRFRAPLFADCTGDGNLGFLAGADFRMGRESREKTGEELAPETADRLTMGASVQWYAVEADTPSTFPECPWAIQFSEQSCQPGMRGDWNWETGMNKNQVTEFESIRDHGLRAVYGNWAYMKNHSRISERIAKHKLSWVAYVAGKRESRRLLGDVILKQQDIEEEKAFDDACVTTTWTIDLHYADPRNSRYFPGEEFRTVAKHRRIKPYPIPYRCFYSRNIPNLMMAGRDISVTHVALGTVRVMRTCGMMGEVVGMAASLCTEHETTPRGVYERYLEDLKKLMREGVGAPPPPTEVSKPPSWLKSDGKNLARTAQVKVSGNYKDGTLYPPTNINDGRYDVRDNGLRWVSDNIAPGWVELAWGKPQTFNAARILTGQAGRSKPITPIIDFVLQVPDGAGWKDIPGAKVVDNSRFDWNAKFPAVTTARLRLYVTATPGDLIRIWELELYKVAD